MVFWLLVISSIIQTTKLVSGGITNDQKKLAKSAFDKLMFKIRSTLKVIWTGRVPSIC